MVNVSGQSCFKLKLGDVVQKSTFPGQSVFHVFEVK